MKKLALAFLFLVTSCLKMEFSAVTPSDADMSFDVEEEKFCASTKLTFDTEAGGGRLTWSLNDWISVWPSGDCSYLVYYVSAKDAATGKETFSFKSTSDESAKAFFKSSSEMYLLNHGTRSSNCRNPFSGGNLLRIPSRQTARRDRFDHESIPFAAHWKGASGTRPLFDIKVFCSLLKIHLEVDRETVLTSVLLTNGAVENSDLNSEIKWGIDDAGIPWMQTSTRGGNTVELVSPSGSSIKSGDYYFIVNPERNLSNLVITFTYDDGTSESFSNRRINIVPSDIPRLRILNIGSFTLPKDPSKRKRYTITEDSDWVGIQQIKEIDDNSALDLSESGVLDAPAGKYGRLKNVNGHFEFENKPGVSQRFFGNNLVSSANYPGYPVAARLMERFARMGYNMVRLHHHDNGIQTSASNFDRMDYLAAEAIKRGIYLTTDLYVSRKVYYRDLGFDQSGEIPMDLYKLLVACYEPAFEDWCRFASDFLNHVNPYTGRAYKDEPALCLLSLVNEPKIKNDWNQPLKKNCQPLIDAWHEYGGSGALPVSGSEACDEFISYLHGRQFMKCSDFVRSLGCKALLTNDNDGQCRWEGKGAMPLYDYIDTHYYVDLPSWPGVRYEYPCTSSNLNPLVNTPNYLLTTKPEGYSRPWIISEWNHCAPSPYRAMGAVWGSAMLSLTGLDALLRFVYAQNASILEDFHTETPGYAALYSTAWDLMIQASEPAVSCFYLRGDVTSPGQVHTGADGNSMTVVTPRSEALYAQSGMIAGDVLSADIKGSPATVYALSIDGNELASSGKILLAHLTDSKGDGDVFGDSSFKSTYGLGKSRLVRAGSATVSLALDAPASYQVVELTTGGTRKRLIPSSVSGGNLVFDISVNGPDGARIYYEITTDKGLMTAGDDFTIIDLPGTDDWE